MKNKLKITTINDEISDDLNETIEFLRARSIKYVELRTIKKKNLIDYSLAEVKNIRETLTKNGISVSAFASPLFKWYPENSGGEPKEKVDTFGFNPRLDLSAKRAYISKAIEVAKALDTHNIRLFSSLKIPSVRYSFISDHLFGFTLKEAQRAGVKLLLENEPPCYVYKMNDVKDIARKFSKQNLGIWFDVANFYKIKEQVFRKDLEELKNAIGYFHLKDFDEIGNYVALGEGTINYKRIISDIGEIFGDKDVFLSIETRVHSNLKEVTKKSLQNLKRLLSEERIGYGIVGCGQVFEKHGSAVSKNKYSELRAVFDIDEDRVVAAAKRFDCEAKNNFNELLADASIDVVNIRTPNDVHVSQALETLKNGKYCLCEKPFCLNSNEGEEILKSKFYKSNITVNFQNRFNSAVRQLLKYLESGALGKIIFCSVAVRWWRDDQYFKDWHGDIKRAGGMLFNQGAHALDLMLQICGPAKKIAKLKRTFRKNTKVDDLYVALIEFKSGAVGNLEITTYTKSQSCGTSLFVIGEKGSIHLGGPSFNKIEFLNLGNESTKNQASQADTEVEDSHFRLIRALNEFLLKGRKSKLLASAEDGVKVTKFIEQLYR